MHFCFFCKRLLSIIAGTFFGGFGAGLVVCGIMYANRLRLLSLSCNAFLKIFIRDASKCNKKSGCIPSICDEATRNGAWSATSASRMIKLDSHAVTRDPMQSRAPEIPPPVHTPNPASTSALAALAQGKLCKLLTFCECISCSHAALGPRHIVLQPIIPNLPSARLALALQLMALAQPEGTISQTVRAGY